MDGDRLASLREKEKTVHCCRFFCCFWPFADGEPMARIATKYTTNLRFYFLLSKDQTDQYDTVPRLTTLIHLDLFEWFWLLMNCFPISPIVLKLIFDVTLPSDVLFRRSKGSEVLLVFPWLWPDCIVIDYNTAIITVQVLVYQDFVAFINASRHMHDLKIDCLERQGNVKSFWDNLSAQCPLRNSI